jgi:hypothetical protein
MNDGFEEVGALELKVTNADRVIVGILEDSPDSIALALGYGGDFVMLECEPSRARQIAASLLNKADSIDGC